MLSVIVTTYNRPRFLEIVLEGFLHQDGAPLFELVVADDGSGPETADVVEAFRKRAPFPVCHAWQEDRGFRAAAVRNLGFRRAKSDAVVYTDGDCVPFPDFLAAHARSLAEPRTCLVGNRCFLTPEETAAFSPESASDRTVFERVFAREEGRLRSMARKNRFYGMLGLKKDRPKLLTSNASLHRFDFERVNGLDERYVGWGQEDDDLGRRLRWAGTRVVDGAVEARVLHLDHPAQPTFHHKVKEGPNYGYFHRGYTLTRCTHGLETRPVTDWKLSVPDPRLLPEALRPMGAWAKTRGDATLSGGGRFEVALAVAGVEKQFAVDAEVKAALVLPNGADPAPLVKMAQVVFDFTGSAELAALCAKQARGYRRVETVAPDALRAALEAEI